LQNERICLRIVLKLIRKSNVDELPLQLNPSCSNFFSPAYYNVTELIFDEICLTHHVMKILVKIMKLQKFCIKRPITTSYVTLQSFTKPRPV